MRLKEKINAKYMLCILCIVLFSVAALFFLSSAPTEEAREDTWTDSGYLKIGSRLTIRNADEGLSLLDSKDVLSADGLYYAAWTMGNSEAYENSDGETVALYDAQLYLVSGEYKTDEEAGKNMTKWLNAGKSNYEVLTEEEITCNGQSYQLITYNCVSENNPYARGVSAFGVHGNIAVCVELTCREAFEEELRPVLTHFLDNCTYNE